MVSAATSEVIRNLGGCELVLTTTRFGIIIPFIARGRKVLVVRMLKGTFKWKPQLAVDKKTRELRSNLQDEIVQACKKAGVHIVDSQ